MATDDVRDDDVDLNSDDNLSREDMQEYFSKEKSDGATSENDDVE